MKAGGIGCSVLDRQWCSGGPPRDPPPRPTKSTPKGGRTYWQISP
jgi:hypothetical protein